MSNIFRAFMMNKKEENVPSSGIKLGDPVMIALVPSNEESTKQQTGLTGIVVDIQDGSALVVWDATGLSLESVVPLERLVAIVN